jgi:hypothetical protein
MQLAVTSKTAKFDVVEGKNKPFQNKKQNFLVRATANF